MLHARVAGLVAGAALILLARNLSVVSEAKRRFHQELGIHRPPAYPPSMSGRRTASLGFTAAGAALILLALLAPWLR